MINEVQIKLATGEPKVMAYCTLVVSGFAIHDVKIIRGSTGPFLSMPSRRMAYKCGKCTHKNHVQARFCNECGTRLPLHHEDGSKLYLDIVHPITQSVRDAAMERVMVAYNEAVAES